MKTPIADVTDAIHDHAGPANAPAPDVLPAAVIAKLKTVLGDRAVLTEPDELLVYEADALTIHRYRPPAVIIPGSAEEVAAAVKILAQAGIPFLPRGAGTGLSGGALSKQGAVLIELARLNRIIEIDYENRFAVVEAGVINLHLSQATAARGFHYAPDPSSQSACTIGGNVAENSGGPHCLKYGMTVNHILGLEVVLPSGDVVQLGG
ncbi:MAG TPA: FAD-binding protein, partial [Blastocatellia bacterium]|nr:FAD-binding protein [Blastocatellia bacterium]